MTKQANIVLNAVLEICKVSDFEVLASCPKLTRLDLRGNPVSEIAVVQSEIAQLLPLVTSLSL